MSHVLRIYPWAGRTRSNDICLRNVGDKSQKHERGACCADVQELPVKCAI